MSDNQYYWDIARGPRGGKARCAGDLRKKHQSIFRGVSPVLSAPDQAKGHRAAVAKEVRTHLGLNIGCEIYLADSVYRWLVQSTKSTDSLGVYRREMVRWIEFSQAYSLSALMSSMHRAQVVEYISELTESGLGQRTCRTAIDVLSAWWSWLIEVGLTDLAGPFTRRIKQMVSVDKVRVVKADGTRQSFTLDEAQQVLAHAANRPPAEHLALALMLVEGLRTVEVLRLERRKVVGRDGRFEITVHGKYNRTRRLVCEAATVQALKRVLKRKAPQSAPLISKPNGDIYTRRHVGRWAKEAARAAGRPEISAHDFRKTSATLMMDAGATLDQAQQKLGHSDPKLTQNMYVTRHRRAHVPTGLQPV